VEHTSGTPAPARAGLGFPVRERLKKRDDIQAVFKRRKAVSCQGAKLLARENGLPYCRVAFTFPRKFGRAVDRNRARRLGREAYRRLRGGIRPGYDLVLLVYPGDVPAAGRGGARRAAGLADRLAQMRDLLGRAGLLATERA